MRLGILGFDENWTVLVIFFSSSGVIWRNSVINWRGSLKRFFLNRRKSIVFVTYSFTKTKLETAAMNNNVLTSLICIKKGILVFGRIILQRCTLSFMHCCYLKQQPACDDAVCVIADIECNKCIYSQDQRNHLVENFPLLKTLRCKYFVITEYQHFICSVMLLEGVTTFIEAQKSG